MCFHAFHTLVILALGIIFEFLGFFFSLWRAFMEDNFLHSVCEMRLIVDDFDGCYL